MYSSRIMLAAVNGAQTLPRHDDLTEWQRFLQSEPLMAEPAKLEPAVSVFDPIAQTLHHLTYNWMTVSLVGTWATSSMALLAFSTLANVPPEPDCEGLGPRSSEREQLTCLQNEIATGNPSALSSGLAWVGQWETTHPLFSESRDLLEAWTIPVLQEARQAQAAGELVQAIDLAAQIPANSPRFEEAQALLDGWLKTQQAIATEHYEAAQIALQNQHWATAFQHLEELQALDHEVFKTGLAEQLAHELEAERQATRWFNRATRQHALGTPEDRAYAIAIASQIDTDTYLWQTTQAAVNQWSDELFLLAQKRFQDGDFNGAIAIAQQIAKNPNRQGMTQDWLNLVWAKKLTAVSSAPQTPAVGAAVGLYPALLATASMQPENRGLASVHPQTRDFQAASPASEARSWLAPPAPETPSAPAAHPKIKSRLGGVEVRSQPFHSIFPEQQYSPSFTAL